MQEDNKPIYDLDLESIRDEIRDYGYSRGCGYVISDEKEEA